MILESTSKAILARLPQQMLAIRVSPSARSMPRHDSFPGKIAADGSFQIKGLFPGRANIHLSGHPALQKGFTLLRIERDGIELRDGIEIGPGEQITGVRVVLAYGTGIVRGQVKIEGGALPAGAQLRISGGRVGAGSTPSVFAQVDARGRFVIEGLLAGMYELTVEAYLDGRAGPPAKARQVVAVAEGAE